VVKNKVCFFSGAKLSTLLNLIYVGINSFLTKMDMDKLLVGLKK
jgi:hypothetical protein